jgi:hypothetical protein
MLKSTLLASVATLALAGAVAAEGCDNVVFSDVGWTDITATTAATTLMDLHRLCSGQVLMLGGPLFEGHR